MIQTLVSQHTSTESCADTLVSKIMKLSVSYEPLTDGRTESFNRVFVTLLRAYVTQYHTDWTKHIPALVYANNNTVHSATGTIPHRLLFGSCPCDIRAPLQSVSAGDSDMDTILHRCKRCFESAGIALHRVRQEIIRASKRSLNAFVYKPGDLVKISTRIVPRREPSTQVHKLWPRYLGPFEVVEEVGSSYRTAIPSTFQNQHVHDVFSVSDIRPWISSDERSFDASLLSSPDSCHDPILLVLDRKAAPGRVPQLVDSLLDLPAQYFAVRKTGQTMWLHQRVLKSAAERKLLLEFESVHPRDNHRLGASVSSVALTRC